MKRETTKLIKNVWRMLQTGTFIDSIRGPLRYVDSRKREVPREIQNRLIAEAVDKRDRKNEKRADEKDYETYRRSADLSEIINDRSTNSYYYSRKQRKYLRAN